MLWPTSTSCVSGTGHRVDELRQQSGQGLAVVGDVQAGVVPQVQRVRVEVAGQRSPVVVPLPLPVRVAHAQAVHEHDDAGARRGDRRGDAIRRQCERRAAGAQVHRDGEGIAARGEVVAQHAVQRGDEGFAPGPRRRLLQQRGQRHERGVDAGADQPRDGAHASVHEPRDALRASEVRLLR